MTSHPDYQTYHFNEGSLQLPAQWQDLSVIVLSASQDAPRGISVTVSRAPIPWGMTFAACAERDIAALSRQLNAYRETDRTYGTLQEKATVTSEFTWTSPQGDIHQLMVMLDLSPRLLVFTATVPGVMDAALKAQITALISTFSLREPPVSA